MQEFPRVVLKPKEEGRIQAGHLWAFSNEIAQAPSGIVAGDIVDLVKSGDGFLGRGFYHPHSLIAFRLLTDQKDDPIDAAFFTRRLEKALAHREWLYPQSTAYRWIFGESDHLPGLIIDRYGDYVVLQILAVGMERQKDVLIPIIQRLIQPKGIVIRGDSHIRTLEGLSEDKTTIAFGDIPERIEITLENGTFLVDLMAGQKTGFFFDQRDNRQVVAGYCKGQRVLDAFCYSGGFGIAAARAGARQVVFIDSSESALALAQENAQRNGVADRCTFIHGDALELLAAEGGKSGFDVISIDPPAYARNRKHLPAAMKAYEKLNGLAMAALSKGKLLATSSCSHHVPREIFVEMLRKSGRKARRSLRLLELRSQAKDHPVLLSMPETEYLKFGLVQII